MNNPNTNLTLVTGPTAQTGETEFWLSDPEPIDDGVGDWGFAIYANKDVFLATFTYSSEADAARGRQSMVETLKGAVFIATDES